MPMSRRAQSRVQDSVVNLRSVHIEGRVAVDELSLFAVAAQAGQRGQLSGDDGSHAAGFFHPRPEQLEVGPLDGGELRRAVFGGRSCQPQDNPPRVGRSVTHW